MEFTKVVFFLIVCLFQSRAALAGIAPSLVVNNTVASTNKEVIYNETILYQQVGVPVIIDHIYVQSNIRNRFANTVIISKVRNNADTAQEAVFSVVLPNFAFISNFVMEVDGQNYTAYVKEKEEAQKDYNEAVASGFGAAHVAVSARDSNRFTVSVNVQSGKKVDFYLTYEQLLKRKDGRYEQVININPGQIVKDLNVEVFINENRKITDLKVPQLRSGNEIGNENSELDPRANIEIVNETVAHIRFSPTWERQKQLARLFNTAEDNGFSGQFVVQYDVERDPTGGEVLIQDGYFVHFFAPSELQSLPKHIIFVLDTSGSMENQRIRQLKQAMGKILEELNLNDLFHLVEFNNDVKVWNLDDSSNTIGKQSLEDRSFLPNAYLANTDNIKIAKSAISNFEAYGGTDILNALSVALRLVNLAKQKPVDDIHREPIIVFLTDGEPTVGETSTEQIIQKVSELNVGSKKSPIFTLSFGEGADKEFLKKLSIKNYGFSKHIYEASDASLQLQDFYKQISSPLLADVQFKYEPSVTNLTLTEFPIHFRGSEIVVAGWSSSNFINSSEVNGIASTGLLSLKPTVRRAISSTERLWAYLTIQQLLEKKESSDRDMEYFKRRALDLSLKYSFVTPLSSLVVVKPNETNTVNVEDAAGVHPTNSPVQNNNNNNNNRNTNNNNNIIIHRNSNNNNNYNVIASRTSSSSGNHFSVATQSLNINQNQNVNLNYASHSNNNNNNKRKGSSQGNHFSLQNLNINRNRNQNVNLNYASHSNNNNFARANQNVRINVDGNNDFNVNINDDIQPIPPRTTLSLPTGPLQDLLVQIPWLNEILNEDNYVTLPTGSYELGLDKTIRFAPLCHNALSGYPARCALLKNCPGALSNITSSHIYMQHMCILRNRYAGICCPNSLRRNN